MYRDKILNHKDYIIAVMVRLEMALRRDLINRKPNSWSYEQCMEGITSAWKEMKTNNGLDETFWSFDTGKYGSKWYLQAHDKVGPAQEEVNTFMKQHHNVSYPDIENGLVALQLNNL